VNAGCWLTHGWVSVKTRSKETSWFSKPVAANFVVVVIFSFRLAMELCAYLAMPFSPYHRHNRMFRFAAILSIQYFLIRQCEQKIRESSFHSVFWKSNVFVIRPRYALVNVTTLLH